MTTTKTTLKHNVILTNKNALGHIDLNEPQGQYNTAISGAIRHMNADMQNNAVVVDGVWYKWVWTSFENFEYHVEDSNGNTYKTINAAMKQYK